MFYFYKICADLKDNVFITKVTSGWKGEIVMSQRLYSLQHIDRGSLIGSM